MNELILNEACDTFVSDWFEPNTAIEIKIPVNFFFLNSGENDNVKNKLSVIIPN